MERIYSSVSNFGLLAVVMMVIGCTNITKESLPPTFSLVSIEMLEESTLFEQQLAIGLRVKNPNDHSINVRGANALLEINAIPFADGFVSEGKRIDAYSDEVFTIKATTNLARLFKQVGKIAETGIVDYALKGDLSLDNFFAPIPFNQTGELSLNEIFPSFQELNQSY